ncbi:MAG: hypothetical protein IIB87_06200 [Chloroflexi bacterium]|nr:hypothetical protein [Chloroflexota bacterium]
MDNIRKSQLFGWLGGAAALAVVALLVVGTLGAGGVHAQEGGATYTGPIDTLTAECGGGTISFILSDDGSSVSQLVLDGVTIGGVAVNTLSDPPGTAFVVDVDLAISGGGFDAAFQPLEGVDAVAVGTFDGDTVSGSFGVEALTCVDVPFTATKAEPVVIDTTLPTSGTGPLSDSGIALGWALAAGAFGIVSLGVGAAVRRRAQ